MAISIFIVDDHQVFQDGIAALISFEPDMQILGKASSVEEFMRVVPALSPDLILMDISLGDGSGILATKWWKEQCPEVKVLILSMHREKKYVREVFDAGADGYLLKDAGTREMMTAIRTVAGGNAFYSKEIFEHILAIMRGDPLEKRKKTGNELTRRELEVLRLIAQEKSNQEIADQLFISIRTVDTHRQNLIAKTGAKNSVGLLKYALRNDLFKI